MVGDIYPDPSILPEKCRDCPAIAVHLQAWTLFHGMTDVMLQLDFEGGLTQEEVEQSASAMPPFFVEMMSQQLIEDPSQRLDPDSLEDRQKLVRMLSDPEGVAYQGLCQSIQTAENEMRMRTGKCESRGPINLRVPDKQSGFGSIIVSLCRNDIKSASPESSVSVARIRRETPRR